jgi:hypothetical protein
MNAKKISLAAAVLALAAAGSANAQTANHAVTYQVSAINQIAVTGSPSLTVSTATAGSAANAVTDATSTWAVTTNAANKKLTAAINSDMPTGVTLEVNAAAPSGATSSSYQTLGTSAVDVVTGIATVNASGLLLTYRLSATLAAGVVSSASKTVTYTLVTGP